VTTRPGRRTTRFLALTARSTTVWLGEELEEKPKGSLAPQRVKNVIEEKLFVIGMIITA
jgi:hypothetical protein